MVDLAYLNVRNCGRCFCPGLEREKEIHEKRSPSPLLPLNFLPRCRYAFSVASLPLGVRCKKPSWIRNGSYTASNVAGSSPTAVAIVVIPTGPPLNFSMIVRRILLSISSSPYSVSYTHLRAH